MSTNLQVDTIVRLHRPPCKVEPPDAHPKPSLRAEVLCAKLVIRCLPL